MRRVNQILARNWALLSPRWLPFADAATAALPLGRLLRLGLFQVSVGMAVVLLNGTLNRVMIVELSIGSSLVALMVSLPLIVAPFRALIGFRSDTHRSVLGWRRVPYIWMGTLLQFGGFAIMPFALILLSGDTRGPEVVGQASAALAFLLVGAGLHTTQTAGLALAMDLAPPDARPRVVALLYLMLLVGMVASGLAFGAMLADFSQLRLVKIVQGAAVLTMVLNCIALWKQEARDPTRTTGAAPGVTFRASWRAFVNLGRARRLLVATGLGTLGFSMQDILLEPYGGQVMHLSVGATTELSALMACGAIGAFALAARFLRKGADPHRLAAHGALVGLFAFAGVIFAGALETPWLLRAGTMLIGFAAGLFAVGTLTATMALDAADNGLALGAWGAVQASAAGLAIAIGGILRDTLSTLSLHGILGPTLVGPWIGYAGVYMIEIALLFATLAAIGPLVGQTTRASQPGSARFGLAQFPG